MKARRIYVFFTRGDGVLSRLIAKVLGGVWTHAGLMFQLADGSEVYYEALAGEGVAGPRPAAELIDWQARRPADRKLLILELPDLAPAAGIKLAITETYKSLVTYSELALLAHWFFARFGVPLKDTPNRVICSELVSRILAPEYRVPCDTYPNHDCVTPPYLRDFLRGQKHTIRYAAGIAEGD
jgi:hypothetical protein